MSIEFQFDDWNRKNEIGLIIAPCGSGKTYASIELIPQSLKVDLTKVLLLFPRTAIKEQVLEQYKDKVEEFSFESKRRRIQVATCHLVGRAFRENKRINDIELVIVDEWHSVFAENSFAIDLLYFQQAFQEWIENKDISVIAMTGTPTLPIRFVNETPFSCLDWLYKDKLPKMPVFNLCPPVEPKYKADEIWIEQNKSLEVCLRSLPASDNHKQIIFVKGKIDRLISLSLNDANSTWLCSKSSRSKIGGIPAYELMNQDYYNAIIDGHMPPGINRIYLSSAYREGLNITDESIQEVIIEGVNDIDIVQSFGRVRHDTQRLVIVIDKRRYAGIDSKVKSALELMYSGDFRSYYELQEEQSREDFEGKRNPILIYKDKDKLLFNYLSMRYWLYCEYSLLCGSNKKNSDIHWFGSKLPKYDEYFNSFLQQYSANKIKYNMISYVRPTSIEQENKERLAMFDWDSWSGKELYAESAKEFSLELNLKNKDYSVMALSGIYKNFPQYFKGKSRKRRNGQSVNVYLIR